MNRGKRVLGVAVVCLLAMSGVFVEAQTAERPAVAVSGVAKADEKGAAGTWQGTLAAGGQNLRLQIKITESDGKWVATIYSLDQSAQFKASAITVSGDAVKIEIATIGGAFAGTLSADGKTMDGAWTQGPGSMPLKLKRANAETAWALPAPPKLMAADADPSFEVATIKPTNHPNATRMQGLHIDNSNRFTTDASSLSDLISFAYDVQLKQIAGNEGWMSEDRYDILAQPDVEGVPSGAQLKGMIQKLLAERFGLKMHEDKREMPAFVLTVAKGGIKFTASEDKQPLPGLGFRPEKSGLGFVMHNATMGDFTGLMQILVLDRPVVDETGLSGRYDMNFTFTPDDSLFGGHPPQLPPAEGATEQAPGMFQAMEEQAGLKLEAKKTAVKVLVIDHVTKPTGN